MIRHLVDAVVWDVGDGDAQLCGGVDGDVVDAHAVPADHDAPLRGTDHGVCDLREAGQDAVHVPGHRDERLLFPVGRDDQLRASLGQNGPFRLHGRPYVVGYQHSLAHRSSDPGR